ncbi:TPA: PTS Fru family IIB subunit [Enterococcus faecium]|nr:PTS Fru family IIB subunit [Enterococcus faecium]HAP7862327.1 PTS Fru family IIB subunit [Enterococcus faecium]
MGKYQLIAATGCPTGIAHTYMAQEALEQAARNQSGDPWTNWDRE